MTLSLIKQQWKAFWRSKNTGKSIAVRIILGIFILYMLLNLLVVAFFLDKILVKALPGQTAIVSFTSFLLYYFLVDLLMRFQLQELPTLSVKPYLHLPVRRKQLVNYLSFISLWTLFNFSPFILTLPFLLKSVLPGQGANAFWGLLISITGLTLFNHFFSLWLKRKVNLNAWFMLAFLGAIALLALLDFYWHLISISKFSAHIFQQHMLNPWYSVLLVVLGVIMYLVNFNYLKNNLYLDELHSASSGHRSFTEVPFLNRFGRVGDLAATELKLIFRNKRSKSAVIMGALFALYGLVFYTNPKFGSGYGAAVFCGMFMTGIFIINYGQFMFSWQSSHFDGILSAKIDPYDFFKSKFLLFTLFATISFVITIPYVYFGWRILMMHTVMYIWNLGVNTLMVLYFANKNFKRIDLSKSASFNWEGVGATQWILSIPLLIGPYVFFLPASLLGYPLAGVALIGVTGLVLIFSREYWLKKLVRNFKENRYKIAEGFRNK